MSVATTSSRFASRQAPKWLPLAVGAGSLILGAAANALTGFSIATFALFAGIIFVIVGPLAVTSFEGKRKGQDAFARYLVYGTFLIALIPLVSVLYTVLAKGIPGLSGNFLSTSMKGVTGVHDNAAAAGEGPVLGGIYHAIIGTLEITLLATVISVPIGLLTAIYLVEYGQGKWLSKAITFFVDVMTGIPSIVAGLFAYTLFMLAFGALGLPLTDVRNGLAGTVALTVLMIPTVVRSSEEMIRLVPNELREASYALGVPKWRTILKVVLPTAIAGISTGVVLAVSRVIGESAPLLIAAGFTLFMNYNPFQGPMMSLPVFVYRSYTQQVGAGAENMLNLAWTGALSLLLIVMLLNLAARAIAYFFAPKGR